MSYHYLFRLIILGHPAVGKTSLLGALNNEPLCSLYQPTIGIDFGATRTHLLCGAIIKTHLWDTAGQEYFSSIVRTYYRNIAGAILVFDVTYRYSFERIRYWLKELKETNKNHGKLILVGNKIDLFPRKVTTTEAEKFAKENDMQYYEISIKNKTNIPQFFYDYLQSIYETIDPDSDNLPPGVKLHPMNASPEIKSVLDANMNDCCVLL
jgi:small GTP-binding protein